MTNFLFWNIGKKDLRQSLARLVMRHEVDVLVLSECTLGIADVLHAINGGIEPGFHATDSNCQKINIFARFPARFISPISESARMTSRRLSLPGCVEILLVATHLQSKNHYSQESQIHLCSNLIQEIREVEGLVGHQRTCLVGDLNMNPFEHGMVGVGGLHAVMSRQVAEKRKRTVDQRDYDFFYNPMWGHLGDSGFTESTDTQPPGTFYSWRSEHVTYFWNMFDQVLLRPDLLPRFSNRKLRILSTDGVQSLMTADGIPDKDMASDHLPILFTLDLREGQTHA